MNPIIEGQKKGREFALMNLMITLGVFGKISVVGICR